jgi:hypothetical protein
MLSAWFRFVQQDFAVEVSDTTMLNNVQLPTTKMHFKKSY